MSSSSTSYWHYRNCINCIPFFEFLNIFLYFVSIFKLIHRSYRTIFIIQCIYGTGNQIIPVLDTTSDYQIIILIFFIFLCNNSVVLRIIWSNIIYDPVNFWMKQIFSIFHYIFIFFYSFLFIWSTPNTSCYICIPRLIIVNSRFIKYCNVSWFKNSAIN